MTQVTVTIANGDSSPVTLNRIGDWGFWDGGVGTGTRIESGTLDWGGQVTVPAFGIWTGSVAFSSPNGSGIYNVYHRKEDMAIQIQMTAVDAADPRRDTCRVMLAFGVNIIKVGDFGCQEHVDLYDAVDQIRQIYEHETSPSVASRDTSEQLAGGKLHHPERRKRSFATCWSSWSVPNDWVDVYVVQQFNWGTFNGFAGDIPGPRVKNRTGRWHCRGQNWIH